MSERNSHARVYNITFIVLLALISFTYSIMLMFTFWSNSDFKMCKVYYSSLNRDFVHLINFFTNEFRIHFCHVAWTHRLQFGNIYLFLPFFIISFIFYSAALIISVIIRFFRRIVFKISLMHSCRPVKDAKLHFVHFFGSFAIVPFN